MRGHCRQWAQAVSTVSAKALRQQGARAFSREKACEAGAQWSSGSWWDSGRKYSRWPSGNWGRDKQAYNNPALTGCQEDEMRTDFLITALSKTGGEDFLGGPVVKNQPADVGGMGSIPGLGRFYASEGNKARVPQLRSRLLLEPLLSNQRSHCCLEKPDPGSWRAAPARQDGRKPGHSNKGTAQPEIK